MTHKTLSSSRHALESCTLQLHTWKPFHHLQTLMPPKTLDHPDLCNSISCHANHAKTNNPNDKAAAAAVAPNKRPCLSDRATAFSIDCLDLSKLSLFEDERGSKGAAVAPSQGKFRWMRNKKRRRGSRSVSGKSSDRSGTRRCCSVGAGTCSDFPVAAAGGTDSSGELFVSNGDPNWSSDVSEARNSRNSRRERRESVGEKESMGSGNWVGSNGVECQGNESGYGSEPGYRGDVEFGYGDEFDEEEDDGRVMFWGRRLEIPIARWRLLVRANFLSRKLIIEAGGRSMTADNLRIFFLIQYIYQFSLENRWHHHQHCKEATSRMASYMICSLTKLVYQSLD